MLVNNSSAEGHRIVILGGTSGVGLLLARRYAQRGADVVITGRDLKRAQDIANDIDGTGSVTGAAVDLADPVTIEAGLGGIQGPIDHVVLTAIERDRESIKNSVREFSVERARRLVTLKVIGYSEAVHRLVERLSPEASIVLFGGISMTRPDPGSTAISAVNGAVTALARSMAYELAPVRVNALHPGLIFDSPATAVKDKGWVDSMLARTPTGRFAVLADIVHATTFLLENPSVNGQALEVDGGFLVL